MYLNCNLKGLYDAGASSVYFWTLPKDFTVQVITMLEEILQYIFCCSHHECFISSELSAEETQIFVAQLENWIVTVWNIFMYLSMRSHHCFFSASLWASCRFWESSLVGETEISHIAYSLGFYDPLCLPQVSAQERKGIMFFTHSCCMCVLDRYYFRQN